MCVNEASLRKTWNARPMYQWLVVCPTHLCCTSPFCSLLVLRGEDRAKIPLYSIFLDPSNYNQFAVSGMDQFARIFDRRHAKGRSERTDPVKNFCPDHLVRATQSNIYVHVWWHIVCVYIHTYVRTRVHIFHTRETFYVAALGRTALCTALSADCEASASANFSHHF